MTLGPGIAVRAVAALALRPAGTLRTIAALALRPRTTTQTLWSRIAVDGTGRCTVTLTLTLRTTARRAIAVATGSTP